MSVKRFQGALLFLAIPLVLVLYVRMPLGLVASVPAGIAIMVAHGFVARPFLARHVGARCFWCGRDLEGAGFDAAFVSRGAPVPARGCSDQHAANVVAFVRTLSAWRVALLVLVVVPVVFYLVDALLAIVRAAPVPLGIAATIFKTSIAAAVVALSFAWPLGRRMARAPATAVPAHNLFLLGIRNTLWVFRIVGVVWLAQAVLAGIRTA